MNGDQPTPYADTAITYWEAGWRGIIPIPYRTKKLHREGWTGRKGAWPSYPDVYDWADNPSWDAGAGNIALRVPHHILGVDIDAYGTKQGAETLNQAEHNWGPLPATWRSTSRDDGTSGIRLYTIPEGLAWPGEIGPGVELIQWCHRYVVVPPSVHPEGRTYRWITPEGAVSTTVPNVNDLPTLPDPWLVGLTGGVMDGPVHTANLADDQARAWLLSVNHGDTCPRMTWAVHLLLDGLTTGGSRHNALRHLMTIVRMAEQGHHGVIDAITQAHEAFIRAATSHTTTGDTRTSREAELEWLRSLTGAINRIVGSPSVATTIRTDPCEDPFADLVAAPNPDAAIRTTAATVGSLATQISHTPNPGEPAGDADDRLEAEIARRHEEAKLLAQEIALQRARRAAKRQLDEEDAAEAFREPVWCRTLTDELAIPDDPVVYTVADVMPTGCNVLLTAQFKTGKTTLINNLTRSLADRKPFLDRFDISDVPGRIAIFNYEVDRRQYRRWLREMGIIDTEKVTPLNLRGYRLPLVSKWVEDWLVRWLEQHEIGVWIVDPFARAFVGSGVSENDNTEVGRFLDTLDVIKSRANVSDLIMPTHTGRGEMEEGQERARGATRLDDWADVRWLLTKDEHDARYFRATGRDVEVEESELTFDETSRTLSLTGGNRHQGRSNRISATIIQVVANNPGIGSRELREQVRAGVGRVGVEALGEALGLLEERGRLRVEQGAGRRPARHYLADVTDLVGGD